MRLAYNFGVTLATPQEKPMRVVKLGGSLLDNADWPDALRNWLRGEPPDFNLLVVGGGAAADCVRQADRRYGLSPSVAHWLAIRAMQFNAELAAAVLSEGQIVRRLKEIERLPGDTRLCIADPWVMLRDEPRLADLPESWSVTSDSIAARLAVDLRAEQLVLLKSGPPPQPETPASWSTAGYVDAYFPQALGAFTGTVSAVDLLAAGSRGRGAAPAAPR